MEIVFITPEVTPYSRTGPTGDVCAALPRGLRSMDHKVTVISPMWSGVDTTTHSLARRLSPVIVEFGDQSERLTVFDGRTTGGVDLVFIAHEALLSGAPPDPSRAPTATQLRAAVALGLGAVSVAAERSDHVDVVHAHGWFAAAALIGAQARLPNARRVLSLHDPRATGPIDAASRAGLPASVMEAAGSGSDASLLRAGVTVAQRVIAASQSSIPGLLGSSPHALGDSLSAERKLLGIAAGLDAARWNPVTDALLPARFAPVELAGKERCKATYQYELGLPVRADVPLLCTVADAGLPDLLAVLEPLLRNDVQLVVAGATGDALERLDKLAEEHTERLALKESLDERGLHCAIAAADAVIIAGDSPATGELHLAAQRYGALPIAPAVGALADGIVDCDANLESGSGFLFELGDGASLLSAAQRALSAYSARDGWARLRGRCMTADVGWERATRRYDHAYRA